ncbi:MULTISPECIES: cupin domain-containing protein [unclassified Nocardia]|uniref:cupin domain-containing protein n=1 Tax=unclassified Nocardia TaxID=2637762 RepID=UPI001CE4305A|nr:MULTISPECIES: cupin domain-containing protein [unclassified Nocardia]
MTTDSTPENTAAQPNRRALLGAGAAALGGAAVGAALVADASTAAADQLPSTAALDDNLNTAPHLFHLTAAEPARFDGGTLQGAHEDNFPVLAGQSGSVYFVRLEPGGVREPHWHPTAWELNFVISGTARWTILGTHPEGGYRNDVFDAGKGDLVFAPQGFFHYFENPDATAPLEVLVVFNTSAKEPNDDIGIVGAFNAVPREVLAAAFGVPRAAFDAIPTETKPVVITKRQVR